MIEWAFEKEKKRKSSVGTQDSLSEGKRPRRKTKKPQVGLRKMKAVTLQTKALSAPKAKVLRGSIMRPLHSYKKLEYGWRSDFMATRAVSGS